MKLEDKNLQGTEADDMSPVAVPGVLLAVVGDVPLDDDDYFSHPSDDVFPYVPLL